MTKVKNEPNNIPLNLVLLEELKCLFSFRFRLNTIREICVRAPLVMNETLLSDLVQYRFKKDKSVVMAARSLITLFRIVNPMLLPKKERVRRFSIFTHQSSIM
jgi:hypothetical protein